MKYRKFIIQNYRAISGPLEINVGENLLMPIIGINESGKTTILHAIFAFDYFNDDLNDDGRHLKDTTNLYRTSSIHSTISAEILISNEEFRDMLSNVINAKKRSDAVNAEKADSIKEDEYAIDNTSFVSYARKGKEFPTTLTITRNLRTRKYGFIATGFQDVELNHILSKKIISHLPYILFFDDFRDSIEEKIEIAKDSNGSISGWLAIIEQLFKQTDAEFSVFNLSKLEERRRKSVLAKVKRHLNTALTKEWQNFRLDDSDALQISIDFEQRGEDANSARNFLKLEIIETDADGDDHYFFIRDRSKGFFWFFNFVMKLEFNPKAVLGDNSAIYLLDEPGSYLHASAQSKLCSKLKQLSSKNKVIYCTHSHYLLDPTIIPLSTIKVADKDGNGNVRLIPIHEHKGNILERRSAFQPVIDALQIKPFILDLNHERVVIVEGIYDYYAMEMLKQGRNISILPSVGATSIMYYVSLMIAWQVRYCALWDNDSEGRKSRKKAGEIFGDEVSSRHFYLLPLRDNQTKCILQDLFVGKDLHMIKAELSLPSESSFQKTITSLYYTQDRSKIIDKISDDTKQNFNRVFDSLSIS